MVKDSYTSGRQMQGDGGWAQNMQQSYEGEGEVAMEVSASCVCVCVCVCVCAFAIGASKVCACISLYWLRPRQFQRVHVAYSHRIQGQLRAPRVYCCVRP